MSGYLQKPGSGGGGGTWGSILGTLSNQTDLQNALNLKYDASNPAGYITSSALSGYTPTSRTITINGTTQDLSSNRSWTIAVPTKTSDLTNDSGFITSSALTGYLQNNIGISGGTTLIGGTASGDNLTLSSTSNATKGKILFGTSAYDEVNNRLGIGTNAPSAKLEVRGISDFWGLQVGNGTVGALFQVNGGNAGFVGFNGSAYNSLDIRSGASTQLFLATNGNVGIGTTSPTAMLHIKAGTATASTAPLKFTSGTNLTTPEAGAMEYNGTSLMFTPSSAVRHGLIMGNTTNSNVFSQYLKGATAFTSGIENVVIGDIAGAALTSGSDNVLLGFVAGNTLTNGNNNQFIGARAGQATGTGTIYTTLIGTEAGRGSGSLDQSIFIGWQAGMNTSASYSQFIGGGSGATNATYSFFGGYAAGSFATGANNSVFLGYRAGYNATGATESIFIGKYAGYNAGVGGVTGTGNIGIGLNSGSALSSGTYNTFLGYKAGDALTTGSKNVAIGYDVDLASNTADGQLSIQNAIFGTGNTGTGTTASTGKIGIYTVAPTCALDVTGGIATSRTTVTAPATTDGNIFSGTYTPTLTGVTNVTSSTAYVCQYMRVGNVVTVSGKIEVTPTLNNTQTAIGISLPIASNFANSGQCGGSSYTVANTVAGHGAAIYADATNDRAEMDYFETHGASDTFAFSFTYQII